jgi:hypothetical protein
MIKVDLEQGTVSVEEGGVTTTHPLDTAEAFNIVSDVWLRAGWDNKYVYSFTWLGRPIIQLPEDMFSTSGGDPLAASGRDRRNGRGARRLARLLCEFV